MDQELMTILSNIGSLVEQAKQMQGAGGEPVAQQEDQILPEEDEMLKKVLAAMKQMELPDEDEEEEEGIPVGKSDEATVIPNDDAEDMIGDLPEETDKNVTEVAKMLRNYLAKCSTKKTKKSEDTKIMGETGEVAKAILALASRQAQVEKALEVFIEGSGLADEIVRMNEVKKSQDQERIPRNDPADVQKTLDFLREQLGQKQENPQPENHTVMKSLTADDGKALRWLFSKNAR